MKLPKTPLPCRKLQWANGRYGSLATLLLTSADVGFTPVSDGNGGHSSDGAPRSLMTARRSPGFGATSERSSAKKSRDSQTDRPHRPQSSWRRLQVHGPGGCHGRPHTFMPASTTTNVLASPRFLVAIHHASLIFFDCFSKRSICLMPARIWCQQDVLPLISGALRRVALHGALKLTSVARVPKRIKRETPARGVPGFPGIRQLACR